MMQQMRSIADLVIDTLEFAGEGRSAAGMVPVARMARLADMLVTRPDAVLDCELSGWREGRQLWLRLQAKGEIELQCQRCLGPMPYALALDTRVQVIPEGQPFPDEVLEDGALSLGADAIAADPALAVLELIEDEVLLTLPIAPRHDEMDKACVPPGQSGGGQDQEKRAASPFAVLAQLKKSSS